MNLERQNLNALNDLFDAHLKNADNHVRRADSRVGHAVTRKLVRQQNRKFKLKLGKFSAKRFKGLKVYSSRAIKIQRKRKILLELALKNMSMNELLQFDKTKLKLALNRYDEIKMARPCCSEFPGSYPFCNPNC